MAALENVNAGLRAEIVKLSTKAKSKRTALQQKLEMENGSAILQKKLVTVFRATVQSVKTSIESRSSKREKFRKIRNVSVFMHDRA